jgi:hypothetical protein
MVSKSYSMQRIEVKGGSSPTEYLHGMRALVMKFSWITEFPVRKICQVAYLVAIPRPSREHSTCITHGQSCWIKGVILTDLLEVKKNWYCHINRGQRAREPCEHVSDRSRDCCHDHGRHRSAPGCHGPPVCHCRLLTCETADIRNLRLC